MCLGSPDVPTPPDRQDARSPDRVARPGDDALRRRRGYSALIRTASGGVTAPLATTGTGANKLGA